MGLLLTSLRLCNFRNYREFVLTPDPSLTILVGPNAVGKTNVMEAVQLVTACESFRRPQWGEVVLEGQSSASVHARMEGDGREIDVDLGVSVSAQREYSVNGKRKRRLADVAGILPSVMFTPDDLSLVKGSAERRRSALDSVGDQLSRTYRDMRGEYERTLRQRNALLKEVTPNQTLLSSLTDRLVEIGTSFGALRQRLFERMLGKMAEALPSLCKGESLQGRYVESWESAGVQGEGRQGFIEGLACVKREESRRGITLVGPHRDDVVFRINGRDAKIYGSQGQQRTLALAWKLAEVGVMTDIGDQAPVLLLDDVMSELDEERRHALALFCGDQAQTIVTTTNLGYFDEEMIDRARVIALS
jgi:DNA replication and repair protein RecF